MPKKDTDNFLFHHFADATLNDNMVGRNKHEEISRTARAFNQDIPKGGMTVWDKHGKPLVAGGEYMLYGKKVTVKREQFGCGNIADTYYHVYFTHSDGKNDSECIEQNGGSLFGGWTYTSKFEPIAK